MFGKKLKSAIVFLGPPGSGKGTQADLFGAKFGLPVISPGELLRHEVSIRSRVGRQVSDLLSRGKLAPDHLVESVLA
jgi:adenylate kinase